MVMATSGAGTRRLAISYISEVPIWKSTYRLVLPDQGRKPMLQGWAIVENQTDNDWTDVQLSLVSGRPISFIQDLYQPLYFPRPVVPVDVVASPYPQTHGGNLDAEKQRVAEAAARRSKPDIDDGDEEIGERHDTAGAQPVDAPRRPWKAAAGAVMLRSPAITPINSALMASPFRAPVRRRRTP